VIEIKDDAIVMDANHFLAGKDLIFDVELVEIVS
jgi:peptidylprolyl isomerase